MKKHIGEVEVELFHNLNNSIQKYVDLFCKKHDLYFEFWIADLTGTIASLSNQYCVDFNDIRLDLEKNIPKDLFMEWYELTLELAEKEQPLINYYHFLLNKKPHLLKMGS